MSTEKALAIVIRMADFSESSRVVTMFTREFGKIAAVAKGAKRMKGPFDAGLDLLSVCNIVFIRKSSASLDLLTEAKLQQRFKPKAGHLGSLYAGYYVAELLDGLSEEYDAHPLLFDEALSALGRFAGESPLDLSILRFELVVLREIGQLPNFEECLACGKPVAGSGHYGFKVSQGGLICPTCLGDQPNRHRVSTETAAALRALAAEGDDWTTRPITPAQSREMRSVMTAAICHALGRQPKMGRYLGLW